MNDLAVLRGRLDGVLTVGNYLRRQVAQNEREEAKVRAEIAAWEAVERGDVPERMTGEQFAYMQRVVPCDKCGEPTTNQDGGRDGWHMNYCDKCVPPGPPDQPKPARDKPVA